MYIYMDIYIYIHTHVHIYTYAPIYIYAYIINIRVYIYSFSFGPMKLHTSSNTWFGLESSSAIPLLELRFWVFQTSDLSGTVERYSARNRLVHSLAAFLAIFSRRMTSSGCKQLQTAERWLVKSLKPVKNL